MKHFAMARFGGDQRLCVPGSLVKLQRWADGVASQGESRQDEAWHGMAWFGSVWQGEAKHDNARRGKARHDKAMQVKARQCNRFGVYCASGGPVIILR